jgi:ribonuclease BN (tRNA processing enzyme)
MFNVYDADRECGCHGGMSMNGVSGPACRPATERMPRCGSRSSAWRSVAAAAFLALAISPNAAFAGCSAPVAVQVLGSGGPDSNDARASSGYLLWLDGEARLLVDAGGGVFLRFGEAKARFESLDAIAITHLHADHVSDLPALLKSGFFGDRQRPLPIVGPSGGDEFPGIKEFMHALFDPEHGAFRYLSGYLVGTGGMVRADITEMDAAAETPKAAFGNDRFKLTAIGVKHGPVPALGYLVEVRGHRIAFAGDQNGDNPAFAAMIKGVDILVMDHAVPEMADPVARQLHARPSEIGLLAAHAGVKQLVLSHNMARSLGPLQESLALIRQHYDGPTKVAEDLMCFD